MREYRKTLGFEEGGPVPLPNYRGRNDYRKRTDEDDDPNDADDKPGYLIRAAKAIAGAIPEKDRYPKPLKGPAVAVGIRG